MSHMNYTKPRKGLFYWTPMLPKLLALVPILGGLGLMFQQQLTAYAKECMEEWRAKKRKERRDRDRITETD